jgi:hypothetical protein
MYHLKNLIFSSCIAIVLTSIGCGKNCKDAKYSFLMQESFSPEKDSIALGDTIWVNSSHSTTFEDLNSQATVDFSNSQIGSNIRILNFTDTSQTVMGAVYDFDIIKIYGNEVGNDNIPTENRGFYYQEINGNYILKLGFIAKKKGVYGISLGNSIGIVQKKGSCEKANVEIDNTNANTHFYYYENFFPNDSTSAYTKKHVYFFKVY